MRLFGVRDCSTAPTASMLLYRYSVQYAIHHTEQRQVYDTRHKMRKLLLCDYYWDFSRSATYVHAYLSTPNPSPPIKRCTTYSTRVSLHTRVYWDLSRMLPSSLTSHMKLCHLPAQTSAPLTSAIYVANRSTPNQSPRPNPPLRGALHIVRV